MSETDEIYEKKNRPEIEGSVYEHIPKRIIKAILPNSNIPKSTHNINSLDDDDQMDKDKEKMAKFIKRKNENEILCLVEWYRDDNYKLKPSYVSNLVLKKFFPHILIKFYESRLILN